MFLGIEIGGTKLQAAIGAGDGTLAAIWRGEVDVARGAAGIREQILASLPRVAAQAKLSLDDLRGAGIGFGGPIDDRRGRVITSHQVVGWDDFPLGEWLRHETGLPTSLANDADAAGLAETLFGAGRGYSPVFYVTVGSGIGGGLIIDKQIFRASGRGAGEIGHLRVPDGRLTDRPLIALEQIASGWAIQETARAATGNASLTTQDVARAAKNGDAVMLDILAKAREAFAEALCHVIALVCPERIILGGGVSLMDDDLWIAPLRRLVAERVFKPFAKSFQIVPASLGEEVVLHGAIGLASQHAGASPVDGEWSI